MSFQEDLYVQRSNVNQTFMFEETPIFIGTASELITETTTNGIESINIPEVSSGMIFNSNTVEADITFWRKAVLSQGNTINTTRTTIFVTNEYEYENIELTKHEYAVFILDTISSKVVFTSHLLNATFDLNNTTDKHLSSLICQDKIPTSIDISLITYKIIIAYIDTQHLTSSNIIQNNDQLNLMTDYIELSDGSILYLNIMNNANNISGLISTKWDMYFDVIDFRYVTLEITDTIPDEFLPNKNNKLGLTLARHQTLSNRKATLFSIPQNTIQNFKTVISILSENDNKLGYFIVPLFIDIELGPILKTLSEKLQSEYVWTENIISYPLNLTKPIISFSKELNPIPVT